MGTFKDIATPLASRGIPITPVRPKSKAAFLEGWQQSATTNLDIIAQWDARFPGHNAACVAKAQPGGFWFWEADSQEVFDRIKNETGHDLINEVPTFLVRSRAGRGHFYFRQTPESIEMGNISQGPGIKVGDWSARVNNEYVVAPGSIHPDTGVAYMPLNNNEILEAPLWLIEWLKSQRLTAVAPSTKSERPEIARVNGLVPHGQIHGYMLREAGRLRAMGLEEESIGTALIELVHKNCAPPIDESKVYKMAKSICNFAAGQSRDLIMSQYNAAQNAQNNQNGEVFADMPMQPELDTNETAARPKFPYWVIKGTVLGTHLVEPTVSTSSKYPEFVFMPAFQIFLNYLSGKIQIGDFNKPILNLYIGLISPYGQYFKSTTCKLVHQFFEYMGVLQFPGNSKAAEGKVVTSGAGSPEGFGLLMQKIAAKNAIMYNDELGKFVSKCGIDGSSFSADILSWYGSDRFENRITNAKNTFSFDAGTYTFGWQWCTTDRGFNRHWPKLAGVSSGLEDRMFFVVSPETPIPIVPHTDPSMEGALEVRKALDAAIQKQKYFFEDIQDFAKKVKGLDARSMNLAQTLALGFTIMLGYDQIEDDAIERAIALVEYRNQAARFLEPIEADTPQGRLQKEIIRELRQACGKIPHRVLERNLEGTRYGTDVWNRAYRGLLDSGYICELHETTTEGKRPMKMVGLLRRDD